MITADKKIDPLTIKDVWQQAAKTIGAVTDTPQREAEILLSHVLGNIPRAQFYLHSNKLCRPEQYTALQKLLERRLRGEPIAYLLGHAWFYDLLFMVSRDTLIPRPDTETLVQAACAFIENNQHNVLDLGTGCGAIAVSIAYSCPQTRIIATDTSEAALQIAAQNIKRYGLHQRISLRRSNWLVNVPEKFSCIVSNPPYIAADDPHLHNKEIIFEPRMALVSDEDGLADIKSIIDSARDHLTANGMLIIEHGYNQGEKVREIFSKCSYNNVTTIHDLANRERVTHGML